MEEKKLTDEELAKAILQNIEYRKTITYFDEWGNCKSIFVEDVLDHIHRLQYENEQLKCDSYRTSWKAKFFEAKKEIERLTEELNSKTKEFELTEKALIKNVSENAELQKQVDELTKENERLIDLEFTQEHCNLYEENKWLRVELQHQLKKVEQDVKDLAKDIWNDITSYYFSLRVIGNATVELDKLAEFWHKRGVEVE